MASPGLKAEYSKIVRFYGIPCETPLLTFWYSNAASLTVALAVGLLIGLDREKHKDSNSPSEAAGVRTFTLVALLGAIAAQVAIAVAGLFDTHAAAASAVRLASSGSLALNAAAFAALLAITTNALVKVGAAVVGGGRLFALRLTPSIIAMLGALWGVWWLT
jgi:MgtC family protein